MVGQQAPGIGDPVLRKHQLERRFVADRVGGAHQGSQLLAACLDGRLQFDPARLQPLERDLFLGQLDPGFAQRARRRCDLLVGRAQIACSSAALALESKPLAGHNAQIHSHAHEAALRNAAVMRRGV
ncbi:MAG: hypothetical protein ABW163_11930, partial [Luteimonas sp.]